MAEDDIEKTLAERYTQRLWMKWWEQASRETREAVRSYGWTNVAMAQLARRFLSIVKEQNIPLDEVSEVLLEIDLAQLTYDAAISKLEETLGVAVAEKYMQMAEELEAQQRVASPEERERLEEERRRLEARIEKYKEAFQWAGFTPAELKEIEKQPWKIRPIAERRAAAPPAEAPAAAPPRKPFKDELWDYFVAHAEATGLPNIELYRPRFEFWIDVNKPPKVNYERVEALLTQIAREQQKRRITPTIIPRIREVTPEEEMIPVLRPVGVIPTLPTKPLSPLPFPRHPSSEEKSKLEEIFIGRLVEMGIDPYRWMKTFKERISDWMFKSWDQLLHHFDVLIEDIQQGRTTRFLELPPMPWKEDTKRRDAIVHFVATKIYKSMEELIEALANYAVAEVTPEEVREVVKDAWQRQDVWFTSVSKEYITRLLSESL